MKYFLSLTAVCLILTGCSEKEITSISDFEETKIDITENKTSRFFAVNINCEMSASDVA